MAVTRRRFLAWLGVALTPLAGGGRVARAQERALAIHDATRNTLSGAVGVRLRRLFGEPLRRAKAWEGRERVALPDPERAPALPLVEALERAAPAAGFAAEPVGAATLARLLHFAYGVTGRSPGGVRLRAAPSAGALYAGEVYVVAERVPGLAPGVYAWAPLEARLVVLRTGGALGEVARALEDGARAEGAAAAVLLTNVFGRYRARYANRGYRYALIDSGHIGENLRLTAASAGLVERSPLRFHDDRLNALLGIDGIDEAVCAVHLVGSPGTAPAEGGADGLRLVERGRAGHPLPESADDAPERYHASTRLVPAEGRAAGATGGASPEALERAGAARREGEAPSWHALPRREPPDTTVETAIAARRSARRFQREAVGAADLAFVLGAAGGHPRLRRAPGVTLRLLVHRVEGVPPGLYRVDGAAPALRPLRAGPLAEDLVRACLGQEKAGEAAAGIAMVGTVARAAERRGERAYRDLCLECGAVAERIYLAAEAVGLAARNLAAFVDERMNALAGADGRREAVLHLTMLGRGD